MSEPKPQNDETDPWSWSLWRDHHLWRDKLGKAAAHKALGIPDDMMIDARQQRTSGLDWKLAAVMAAAGLGGYALYQNGNKPDETIANPPSDSEYEVRFFDRNMNPIDLKPLPVESLPSDSQ